MEQGPLEQHRKEGWKPYGKIHERVLQLCLVLCCCTQPIVLQCSMRTFEGSIYSRHKMRTEC